MITKEAILKDMGCLEALGDYMLIDHVLESMEDYAKQEAIEFAEWLKDSNYEKSAYNGLYYEKNQVIYKSIQYTLGQLYELYLKTQK